MRTELTAAILRFGEEVPSADLFPTEVPEAASFATTDPFAFALACCLDRGAKAEVIWTIPYDVNANLGHLDPAKLAAMSLDDLRALVSRLPRKPRYWNDAPRTIHDLAAMVCEEFGGDASKIWRDRSSLDVKRSFLRIHGVGNGIANMAVLLIERAFDLRFPDIDRPSMDIKPDVHTMRVLYRMGVSADQSPESAMAAARALNPAFPGELDAPLWSIGRRFCRASFPLCLECPVTGACEKYGLLT